MLFFLSKAVTHDGSAPVQVQVEANPLKRPALVTLEGTLVAPTIVKQKRKSPIKKAGNWDIG